MVVGEKFEENFIFCTLKNGNANAKLHSNNSMDGWKTYKKKKIYNLGEKKRYQEKFPLNCTETLFYV